MYKRQPQSDNAAATASAVAAALSDWGTETGAIEVADQPGGADGDRLPMDKLLAGIAPVVHELSLIHI